MVLEYLLAFALKYQATNRPNVGIYRYTIHGTDGYCEYVLIDQYFMRWENGEWLKVLWHNAQHVHTNQCAY